MKIDLKDFRVPEGEKADLKERPTVIDPFYRSKKDNEKRKFWKQYRRAYEERLSATITNDSPWFVVPADDKENARLIVSRIVVDALDGLGMSYPTVTSERAGQLQAIRAELVG